MSEVYIYLIGFEASRTRFLIPHFIPFPLFAFPFAGAVDKLVLPEGMQEVNFGNCQSITGTADLRMSDGHIYLIRFEASRTHFLIPHFILLSLFAFPFAGAVDKLVLPEGMQEVNFGNCQSITGMAESG